MRYIVIAMMYNFNSTIKLIFKINTSRRRLKSFQQNLKNKITVCTSDWRLRKIKQNNMN